MARIVRYQGAIIDGDQILLIRRRHHDTGRAYWLLPGGGQEPGESKEECVCREMLEETSLEVIVERLLLDEPNGSRFYERAKTYLCRVVSGEARPGYEPEEDAAASYGIVAVGWYDLRDPASWGEVRGEPITEPQLHRLREVLGYIDAE